MNSFFRFIFICSLSFPGILQARISTINSDDLSPQDLKSLSQLLGIETGRLLDREGLDKALKSKEVINQYSNIKISIDSKNPEKQKLKISALKLQVIESVDWSHLEKYQIDIRDWEINLRKGTILNALLLKRVASEVASELRKKGYFQPDVSFALKEGTETDKVVVAIEITEQGRQVVSKVFVEGAEDSLKRDLIERLNMRLGDSFDQKNLDLGVRKIEEFFLDNQYFNAQVKATVEKEGQDSKKVAVRVVVQPGQRFQIIFEGNKIVTDSALRGLIDAELLRFPDAQNKIKDRIEQKYKGLGFHFVAVKVSFESEVATKKYLVKVTISEGDRVFIDAVVFDGVWREDLPSPQKLFFESAVGVIARRLYWEAGIADSTSLLLVRLRKMGFLSVSITGPRVFFSEDKKGVKLFYDLQLGKMYLTKKIRFEGVQHLSVEDLTKESGLQLGRPVDRTEVNEATNRIRQAARRRGYLDASVEVEERLFEFESGQTSEGVELVITVKEGSRYTVGTIGIEGLKKTQERVVRREIRFKEGDVFDPDKVSQSEDNIALLGLFGRVEAVTSSSEKEPTIKNVLFVLSEIRPGFGEVGVGGLYEDPLFRARTFLGLGYRNLFGLNQTASLRSEVSLPISRSDVLIPFIEYAAILNYRAPYFLELPFVVSVQGGFDSFQVASSADGKKSDLQTKARVEERIEKRLSQHFSLQYRLHRLERTRTEVIERTDSGKTQTLNDTVDRIGSTGFILWADYRNDLFNPTSGSVHFLDVELAHPHLLATSELSFLLALQRNSFYFPLTKFFSFAIFSGVGWSKSLLSQPLPEARLANELALGGQGSIRGYAPRLFRAPSGTRELAFYNVRSELSFPLFGDVSGALFFDTGQLFPDGRTESRNDGVGVGVRYKTPVGPIVLDLAHGLSPAAESIVRFTFTVGSI